MKMLPKMILVIFSMGVIQPVGAADFYMTKLGAGLKNGSNWENAFAITARTAVLNTTMQPGDTLYLAGENYGTVGLAITTSGGSAARKSVVGVDRGSGLPIFQRTTYGGTGVIISGSCGYWTISNLRIDGYATGVLIENAVHPEIILDNVHVRNSTRCFSINDADGILIQNSRADRYTEMGFSFLTDNNGVTIKNCVADFTGSGDVDDPAWRAANAEKQPVGFNFHSKNSTLPFNTDILMEDCAALNNDQDTLATDDYEQGDGIKVEQRNAGVTLRRCLMKKNQDGGCDLKGSGIFVEDCVVVSNLKYGIKVWYEGTFTNCLVANSSCQFWMPATNSGYTLTANNLTLYCSDTSQAGISMSNLANVLNFNNSIIASATTPKVAHKGVVNLNNSVVLNNTAVTTNPPRFVNPITPWNGTGNNYDNLTYGSTKGYNSEAAFEPVVVSVNLSDSANALGDNDVVGAVPAALWNNSVNANESLANVDDNQGNSTDIDVAFASTAYGYTNNTGALPAPMDDDAKMMRSTRALSNNSSMQVTVSQVPYSSYDVYVYWGGRTSGETVPATMTVDLQQNVGGTWSTTQTFYMKDGDRTWDGGYNESGATTAAAAVDGNEYIVFRNVSVDSFRIKSTCGVRTGISGFQIVEH